MTRKGLTIDGAVAYAPSGLAGSTAASRYVGATASGAPTTGAHVVGDWVIAQNGHVFICTVAGTPGTWVDAGSSGAVTSVAGRTGVVVLTAADIGAGTFPTGTFNFPGTLQQAGSQVYTSANPPPYPVTTVAGRGGTVALTAADIGAGTFPGANSFTGLQTMNAGLVIPAGQPLTVGTKKTFTGALALAATANTATVLGQFSTTAGAMSLRIHAHLVAGTTQRTKTYEFVVDTATDTTNTYYYVLPADQSTATSSVSDVFLVCYRPSTATTTWQFWVCSSGTFASTGAFTWTAESYGDAVVTFASTLSPATTAPALPFPSDVTHVKYHPSNYLDTVAGRVGVGVEGPSHLLHVLSLSNTDTLPLYVQYSGTGAGGLAVAGSSGTLAISAVNTNASGFSDALFGDTAILASAGLLLLSGGGSAASMLRISGTDVQVNDNGTARSVPRGLIHEAHLTANGAQNVTTNVFTTVVGTVSTDNGTGVASANLGVTWPAVAGRVYRVSLDNGGAFSNIAGDGIATQIALTTNPGGTFVGTFVQVAQQVAAGVPPGQAHTYHFYCTTTGTATAVVQIRRNSGTGNLNGVNGTTISVSDAG